MGIDTTGVCQYIPAAGFIGSFVAAGTNKDAARGARDTQEVSSMPAKLIAIGSAVLSCVACCASVALGQIAIPTVPIGTPGNLPDPTTGYGSVSYAYRIGTTEVTNAQYAAFLNAVAAADTNGLYNTNMGGGVERTGSPGSYTYSPVNGRESHPVVFVSFWNATRFANWLHNGQPTGVQDPSTTEDGAYTLNPTSISSNTVTRNSSWRWAVTSEDEWYKAAYHQPADQGGDTDSYWLFPTSSNSISTGLANYGNAVGGTAPVGSYAANYYGVFDMAGNSFEWNDTIIAGTARGHRGGRHDSLEEILRADNRNFFLPSIGLGFRVSQIPAPSSVLFVSFAGLLAARRRR